MINIHIGDRFGSIIDNIYAFKKMITYKIAENMYFGFKSEMYDYMYEEFSDFIPKKNDIVFDVGAQYGDYSIICSKKYNAKVYAFEPIPINYLKMKNLMVKNDTVFVTENLGLGNQDEFRNYTIRGDMLRAIDKGGNDILTFYKLDTYLSFQTVIDNIEKIDILKIDVEGHEMEVLEGATNTLEITKKIIIEVHTNNLFYNVNKFLLNKGFKLKHNGNVRRYNNHHFDMVVNLFYERNGE